MRTNRDGAQLWFIAGVLSGPAAQVLALIVTRTLLAFGDGQFAFVGAIAIAAALLTGSAAIVGGAMASRTSSESRKTHALYVTAVMLSAILPTLLWRTGGAVTVTLLALLALCGAVAYLIVGIAHRTPALVVERESDTGPPHPAVPATLWAFWGALIALVITVEGFVAFQIATDPLAWVQQTSEVIEGRTGLRYGRSFSALAGVVAAPLALSMLAWVFYWAAVAYSRPKELRSVAINPFPPRGPVRLTLMTVAAVGLIVLQFVVTAAWDSVSGGPLPTTAKAFFALQHVFLAPIYGAVIAFSVRGERRQRPLALGILVGALAAIALVAATILI